MANAGERGLDPVHILAVCARATGDRRVLAVRKAGRIMVCILPSRRSAHRAGSALRRVGYEITTVSAGRGRDLLVTGRDPTVLDSRLATMRIIVQQLADNPTLTARAVIERFRDSPAEARTRQRQWELLNQARTGLRDFVTTRSGIYALRDATIQSADDGIAPRLRAAAALEQVIDDHVERQLRVAGYALDVFRQLSGRTDGDAAEDTAIRWAGIAFYPSGRAAPSSSSLMPRAGVPTRGATAPDQEADRASGLGVRPVTSATGSRGWTGLAERIAAEFPRAALTGGSVTNVVSLDPARRAARPGPAPRLHP